MQVNEELVSPQIDVLILPMCEDGHVGIDNTTEFFTENWTYFALGFCMMLRRDYIIARGSHKRWWKIERLEEEKGGKREGRNCEEDDAPLFFSELCNVPGPFIIPLMYSIVNRYFIMVPIVSSSHIYFIIEKGYTLILLGTSWPCPYYPLQAFF